MVKDVAPYEAVGAAISVIISLVGPATGAALGFIKMPQRKSRTTLITTKRGNYMKHAVLALMLLSITGCDTIPGSNKEEVSIGCINHANAIATDSELQMMRTGYGGVSEVIINANNCRYYFFNPDAKNGKGMRKEEIKACDDLRPEFHAAAVQLKQQALSICLSMK